MAKYDTNLLSGNIRYIEDESEPDGYLFVINNPRTDQCWQIPTHWINPDDLRVMADFLESKRTAKLLDNVDNV